MTPRFRAAVAAGSLVIGMVVGIVGTTVVRDATTTDLSGQMRVMSGPGGPMGGDMSGMMSMMGGSPMGPNASMPPGDHESHHAGPTPEATR